MVNVLNELLNSLHNQATFWKGLAEALGAADPEAQHTQEITTLRNCSQRLVEIRAAALKQVGKADGREVPGFASFIRLGAEIKRLKDDRIDKNREIDVLKAEIDRLQGELSEARCSVYRLNNANVELVKDLHTSQQRVVQLRDDLLRIAQQRAEGSNVDAKLLADNQKLRDQVNALTGGCYEAASELMGHMVQLDQKLAEVKTINKAINSTRTSLIELADKDPS